MRKFCSGLAHTILRGTVAVSAAIAVTSCIDNAYDLDNISKEVTVGGDVVILPLGELEEKSLGELIGDANTELVDEDGVYKIKYTGEGDTFTIDGITIDNITGLSPNIDPISFSAPAVPDFFDFSRTETSFTLDYPDIDPHASIDAISVSSEIDTGIQLPSGNIPALGSQSLKISGSDTFVASFDIPEEVSSVNRVYFGADPAIGSPVNITLSLNGLKSIVGGGRLDLSITFPESYELTDANGASTGNRFTVNGYDVAPNTEKVTFTAYLRSINISDRARPGATTRISDRFEYECNFDFEAVEGYYNASYKPAFEMKADIQYNDMEVVTNLIHIENASQTSPVTYTFDGIPESISEVRLLAFDNAPVSISAKGIEWLESDIITMTVKLPEGFSFEPDANGYLDTSTNTVTAPVRELEKGLRFMLTSIDCTKCQAELKGGQMTLSTEIYSSINDLPAGQRVMLSSITPDTDPVTMTTIMDESRFTLDLAECEISMREQYFDFNLNESNYPKIEKVIEIPEEIVEIDRVDLAAVDGGDVTADIMLSIPDGTVFPIDEVELNLSINLRQMICPAAGQSNIYTAENGDRILSIEKLKWRPNDNPKLNIASVVIEAIENLPEITGGKGGNRIEIDETLIVSGGISTAAGADVNLEAEGSVINIDFNIDDAAVTKFTGKVAYETALDTPAEIDLGNIADYELKLDNLGVDPIIKVTVDNPVGVPFEADIMLTPYDTDDNPISDNAVMIGGIRMEAEAATNIVISTEERRAQFEGDNSVTFVAADIDKLLQGSIPSRITIDMEARSAQDEPHTIDLTQSSYTIAYDYSIEIPLEFDSSLDISYESTFDDLSGTFSEISGKNISVGEIALLAEFTTTIPLDMVLSATFFDSEGNETEAKAVLDSNCIIKGYNPADGDKGTTSTIEIKIDLGEDGNLNLINDIDVLKFKINLRNNSASLSSLSSTQTIKGLLKVRVKDGITVDIDEFTK